MWAHTLNMWILFFLVHYYFIPYSFNTWLHPRASQRIRLEGSSDFQSSLRLAAGLPAALHQTQLCPAESTMQEHFTVCPGNISQGSNPSGKLPLCPVWTSQAVVCNHYPLLHCPAPPRTCFRSVEITQLPVISRSTTLPYVYTAGTRASVASSPGSTSQTLVILAAFWPPQALPTSLLALRLATVGSPHLTEPRVTSVLDATLPCNPSVAAKEYLH